MIEFVQFWQYHEACPSILADSAKTLLFGGEFRKDTPGRLP
jgi:hypothetical protein